ncbi:dihydrofolate reductase [Candidatus Woesearchaeota archaeon]|nr:dihydrofolate reductase [Candidatus Woesearchaeota archaeon]
MVFKQIVALDDINISKTSMKDLEKYSENPVKCFDSDPDNEDAIKERIKDADCILLSWRTPITKAILSSCPQLKFICLCGTNSNCINLDECKKQGIIVSNVVDYGDEGVVEWIFFHLLALVRGFGKYMWKDYPAELAHKTIGIIGLGAVGKLLADAALGLKMNVLYNSKTRKPEFEKKGLVFVEKKELLKKSDIISLQTPKNVKILEKEDFDIMQGKILVNTTLGLSFNEEDFINWIEKPNNFVIMDISQGKEFYEKVRDLKGVIFSELIAGRTKESVLRLSNKVLDNVKEYLEGSPINRIN